MSKLKILLMLFFLILSFTALSQKFVIPSMHASNISRVIVSKDNRLLITGSADGTVKVWDYSTLRLLNTITVGKGAVYSLYLTNDNKKIIAGLDEVKTFMNNSTNYLSTKIISLSGEKTQTVNISNNYISSYAELPNGNIISSTYDEAASIIIWDPVNGKVIDTLIKSIGRHLIENIVLTGNKLVMTGGPGMVAETGKAESFYDILIFDIRKKQMIDSLHGHTAAVYQTSLSKNGNHLLSISHNEIALWDLSKRKQIKVYKSGNTPIINLKESFKTAFFNDHDSSLTLFSDYHIYRHSLYKSKSDTFSCHSINGETVLPIPRYNDIVSTSYTSGEINILTLEENGIMENRKFQALTSKIEKLQLYDDNNLLLISSDGKIDRLYIPNCQIIPFFKPANSQKTENTVQTAISFAGDIISQVIGDSLFVWEKDDYISIPVKAKTITDFQFFPRSNQLAWIENGIFFILDVESEMIHKYELTRKFENFVVAENEKKIIFHNEPSHNHHYWFDINNVNNAEYDGDYKIVKFFNHDSLVLLFNDGARGYSCSIVNVNQQRAYPIQGMENAGTVNNITFSNNPNFQAVLSSAFGDMQLWFLKDAGYHSLPLDGHYSFVKSVCFSPSSNTMASLGEEGSIILWKYEARSCYGHACNTYSPLYRVINDDSSYAFFKEPYYFGSKAIAKKVSFVFENNLFPASQFDLIFNRPDKVLEKTAGADSSLIESYKRAWEKRIKKSGLKPSDFQTIAGVPLLTIKNREKIPYEVSSANLKLNILGQASTELYNLNVFINHVPLYGQKGIVLSSRHLKTIDTLVAIPLSYDLNVIEVSVTDTNGIENFRYPLTVFYRPNKKENELTYFVGIGVDRFLDGSNALKYSVKDIRDLATTLYAKLGDKVIIDTLFNEKVSLDAVKNIKEKLKKFEINDQIIIAYSGHGVLSDSLDYFLSTYKMDFKHPEKNGLPYEEIENLLDSIPARKKLLLIDACHSGGVDKDERNEMDRRARSLGLIKDIEPESTSDDFHLSLKNSFDLMTEMFAFTGTKTGTVIIAAAAGNQYALEGLNGIPNGVFTACVLSELRKNTSLLISELKNRVYSSVVNLTGGLQHPTTRGGVEVDWRLW